MPRLSENAAVILCNSAMLEKQNNKYGGDSMKMLSAAITACLLLSLAGCDAKDDLNKPKAEVRTMIIGGVPAHDQDYRIPKDSAVLAQQHQQ